MRMNLIYHSTILFNLLNYIYESKNNHSHVSLCYKGVVFQETPLYMACIHGDMDIVKILVEAGADINETAVFRDGSNTSPLWVAARNNHIDLCRYLLSKGSRVNNGYSALMGAVDKGREEIVRILLEAGANPNKVGDDGETPMDRARLRQHETILKLLEQYDSDSTESVHGPFNLETEADPAKERTFIMIKPDGVHRALVGEITKRFEQKGLKLVAIRMMAPSEAHLRNHYADHAAKSFFPGLIKYMASGPVVAMAWEGENAVRTGRLLLGETDPSNSEPGTVRGDYCVAVGRNMIHGSDSVEAAKREIGLWFREQDLCDWKPGQKEWVFGKN